ncbi:3-hydroxyacyl-CoA dehydrogenase family protein [Cognatishimia sp. WU-CL00825]|uniref:3-hydroxyacyl-CoA dehydrogenase family protein n=1 Tax=Cognatishimia sp. WU-CL00825 TaxID=3127658 RepID=UPI0033654E19
MSHYAKVTVAGAGTMGHAIALVHAIGGCRVTLTDLSPTQLEWAGTRLQELAVELVDLGLIKAEESASVLDRVTYTTDLAAALKGSNLLIEAIIEDADIKEKFFAQVAELMDETCILASNTSFLDVFPLLPESLRHRCLIVHWYTPPYLIDLVDVVAAPDTPAQVALDMKAFLQGLGKKPVILKKFVPGYIANNVQMAIESEIFRLLDAGVADASDIDEAVRFGLAHRLGLMGQFKKIDYTGLQVVRDIHEMRLYTPPSKPTGSKKLEELLNNGDKGLLTGRGFYDYSDEDASTYLKRRDRKLLKVKKAFEGDDEPL